MVQNRIDRGKTAEYLADIEEKGLAAEGIPRNDAQKYQRRRDIRKDFRKDQFNALEDLKYNYDTNIKPSIKAKKITKQALKGLGRLAVVPAGVLAGAGATYAINSKLRKKG